MTGTPPMNTAGDTVALIRAEYEKQRKVSGAASLAVRQAKKEGATPGEVAALQAAHDAAKAIMEHLRAEVASAKADAAALKQQTCDAPTVPDDDTRSVILLSGGKMDKNAAQAQNILATEIYVRGGCLVRIGRACDLPGMKLDDMGLMRGADGVGRSAAQAICLDVSPGWLRIALMERATFWKFDKRSREWDQRDCPKELVDLIVDQKAWPTLRALVTIATVPFLRPDMSVCETQGYDVATGIYYQPTTLFAPLFPTPTREHALAALARLREPFNEFPYATPIAEAVFISHVITQVLRASFDTSPVFFYTAPLVANGKTLLSNMPSIIAHGVDPANHTYVEKEELRKTVFASLVAGDSTLIFDNVPNGIKVYSSHLCTIATSPVVGGRILGVTKNSEMPNRATIVLTGNNISAAGDLPRRTLTVRLDVNKESARGRNFRIADIVGHIKQRRPEIIVDVLTIARAYGLANVPRPADYHPLEKFEQWDRLCRAPLLWLGMPDPVASQEAETEDEVAPLRAAFAGLAKLTAPADRMFTSATLTPMINLSPDASIKTILMEAGCTQPSDVKPVGYWLREYTDRIAGGWKLMRVPGDTPRWLIKATEQGDR